MALGACSCPQTLVKLTLLVCGTGLDVLSPFLPYRITSSTWSLRNSSQGKANVHMTPSWTQPQPSSVSDPTPPRVYGHST